MVRKDQVWPNPDRIVVLDRLENARTKYTDYKLDRTALFGRRANL